MQTRGIAGRELTHFVSSEGVVWSVDHVVMRKDGIAKRVNGRVLKQRIDRDGYAMAKLPGRSWFVHLLVLEAFVGPRPEGMQACHNNGCPSDNRLENLRWDTPCNNQRDRIAHGTYQYGQRNPSSLTWRERRK